MAVDAAVLEVSLATGEVAMAGHLQAAVARVAVSAVAGKCGAVTPRARRVSGLFAARGG